jgi:hypothetical protein
MNAAGNLRRFVYWVMLHKGGLSDQSINQYGLRQTTGSWRVTAEQTLHLLGFEIYT